MELNEAIAKEILSSADDCGQSMKWELGGLQQQKAAMCEYAYLKAALFIKDIEGLRDTSKLLQPITQDSIFQTLEKLFADTKENANGCQMEALQTRVQEYLHVVSKQMEAYQSKDLAHKDKKEVEKLEQANELHILELLQEAYFSNLRKLGGDVDAWLDKLDKHFVLRADQRVRARLFVFTEDVALENNKMLQAATKGMRIFWYVVGVSIAAFAVCMGGIYLWKALFY